MVNGHRLGESMLIDCLIYLPIGSLYTFFHWQLQGPQMIHKEFPPAFPLKHQQKDMNLALGLGGATGQYLPIAAAANEIYLSANLHGLGDLDFSAVIKALHRGDL